MTVGDLDTLVPFQHDMDVLVPLEDVTLEGFLSVPANPKGIVLFAHGSGGSRYSRNNHYVAEYLYKRRLSTLLMDLLTPEEGRQEAKTRHLRFDIGMLASRLLQVLAWMGRHETIGDLPVGILGSSTGAAAAMVAAASCPQTVKAVVLRGGRPDLAGSSLAQVEAPTLLIVGSNDHDVLRANREALKGLNSRCRLKTVPGASHVFAERGALEKVAQLSAQWFGRYLA